MTCRTVSLAFATVMGLATAGLAQQQITIVNNLPGAVININQPTNSINQHFDEENDVPTTIGNSVFPAGNLRVGRNGAAAFVAAGGGTQLTPNNSAIPSGDALGGNRTIVVYWDDIGNHRDDSDTYVEEIFGAEEGVLVVQYKGTIELLPPELPILDFQIQIFSPPRIIGGETVFAQMLYSTISEFPALGGASATIGVQAEPGAADPMRTVQWSFNTPGAVADGGVLSVTLGCPGDFNRDGFVDFFDIDAFIHCFEGEPCPPDRTPDSNGDGVVDFFDLDTFFVKFETGCL